MNKLEEWKKIKLKIKPDIQAYDMIGNVVQESYSKSKYEELKKASQDVEKLDQALLEAINENKFDKLSNLIK